MYEVFFMCFASGSYFRVFHVWSSYKKNLKTFLNLGFPALGQTDSAQISLNIFH